MMPAISIQHTLSKLSADLGLLAQEQMPAAVRAINRTMTTVRADGARQLAQDYPGLKVGAIKARIRFDRASRAKPSAVLTFSGKRLRLFNFRLNLKKTRWGTGIRTGRLPENILRVDAITGRARPVTEGELSRAFAQRSRATRVANVWLRQGKESMPIDVLLARSISETVAAKRISEALARKAVARFHEAFVQEARFRLSKRSA